MAALSRSVVLALATLACAPSQAAVALAGIFGDHMVMQRGAPIRVWGTATAGESVRVALGSVARTTRAGRDGRWQTMLPARSAGGPYELAVTGASNTVHLRDVLIGDVWLCSGQSNMEWTLAQSQDAAAEIAAADLPLIRHVKVAHRASVVPLHDIEPAPWQAGSPQTAGEFSAVAYHFARRLQRDIGVPIGLVNMSWGGSHIETWTSARTALTDPDLAPSMQSMPSDPARYGESMHAHQLASVRRWQGELPAWAGATPPDWQDAGLDDSAWPELNAPQVWEEQGLPEFDGTLWYRRSVELTAAQAAGTATLHLGMIDDCDETWVNGRFVGKACGWDLPRRYELPTGTLRAGRNLIAVRVLDTGGGGGFHGKAPMQLDTAAGSLPLQGRWKAGVEAPLAKSAPGLNDWPTLLFNGMAQPLVPLRIRGVIWYQGESNVGRAARYAGAFSRLIADWRAHWGQPSLPFYYVQLASFLQLANNTLEGSRWAELRDAQRQMLELAGTGMVVTTDVGDANDIHPRDKRPVGERLALLALRRTYGHSGLEDSGPVWRGSRMASGGRIELSFDHAAGLAARGGGASVQGFAVAGADHRFVAAQARIEGHHVIVWSDAVSEPRAVRYGWVDNPEQSNLVNAAGLPASPFRTDRWSQLSEGARYGDGR